MIKNAFVDFRDKTEVKMLALQPTICFPQALPGVTLELRIPPSCTRNGSQTNLSTKSNASVYFWKNSEQVP